MFVSMHRWLALTGGIALTVGAIVVGCAGARLEPEPASGDGGATCGTGSCIAGESCSHQGQQCHERCTCMSGRWMCGCTGAGGSPDGGSPTGGGDGAGGRAEGGAGLDAGRGGAGGQGGGPAFDGGAPDRFGGAGGRPGRDAGGGGDGSGGMDAGSPEICGFGSCTAGKTCQQMLGGACIACTCSGSGRWQCGACGDGASPSDARAPDAASDRGPG